MATLRAPALLFALAVVLAGQAAGPARAGPPFLTDDPETTDPGHWENYAYASGVAIPGGVSGEGGLDMNWGAARDLQVNVVAPLAFDTTADPRLGLGDLELAVKYRFLRQSAGSPMPDVAVYPRLYAPTASGRFGTGRAALFLPVWAQKDLGPWSLFGGGGFEINPGRGERDFWSGGMALSRAIDHRLSAGMEVFSQARSSLSTPASTVINFGITYRLAGPWSLLASGGPGLENTAQTGRYDFYLALEAQY